MQPKIENRKPARLGYSLREAAECSSLSRRSLEYLIEKGALQAVKIGRRTIIRPRSLEKLCTEGTSVARPKKEKSPAATELESVNQSTNVPSP